MYWCSLAKATYIIYVMIFFKTKYSVNHPLEIWLQDNNLNSFLSHPVTTSDYINRVCPLGKLVAVMLAGWILVRSKLNKPVTNVNRFIWEGVMVASFIMNLNVFVYLLPVYLLDR
jgi:hypothetical protein